MNLGLSYGDWLSLAFGFTFQLDPRALEKDFDHFAHAFLHLRANCSLAKQNCKAMQVLCIGPAEFDMLGDTNQDLLPTLFEGSSITQVVLHFRAGWRPLQPVRLVLGLFHGKTGVYGTDHRNFGTDNPTHDSVGFFPNAFDSGH